MTGRVLPIIPGRTGEEKKMAQPERVYTADDWLHDRRRRMAERREPIDFQQERLKQLMERARDTCDP